jgi:hypothetical protein
MATKLLTMSELRSATYGTFSRSGVRVDLGGFFNTKAGRKAIKDIQQAKSGATGKALNEKTGRK